MPYIPDEVENKICWNGHTVTSNLEPYVIEKIAHEYQNCVYSDRLMQEDYNKFTKLFESHFHKPLGNFNGVPFFELQNFLKEWYQKPYLKLIGIMRGVNAASYNPYWIFMFNNR